MCVCVSVCDQLAEEENDQRRRQEQMLLEKLEQEEQQVEEEEETKVRLTSDLSQVACGETRQQSLRLCTMSCDS